ncbi:hypothetical protein ACC712_38670, partial [Rhizobium ruizarguesonis]
DDRLRDLDAVRAGEGIPRDHLRHLATGGNAVVILTHDAAKQDAAWKFAKFAAGPYGASVVVPGTGYVPNNELAAKSA